MTSDTPVNTFISSITGGQFDHHKVTHKKLMLTTSAEVLESGFGLDTFFCCLRFDADSMGFDSQNIFIDSTKSNCVFHSENLLEIKFFR